MSVRTHWSMSLRLAGACTALLALSGCERDAEQTEEAVESTAAADELAILRDALKRNPHLEVLASDADTQVFTVRNKQTGAVEAVKASELAAAPLSQLTAASVAAPAAPSAPASAPAEPAAVDTPANAPSTPAASAAASQPNVQPNYTIERSAGQLRVSGPGVSIVSSGEGAADASEARRATDPIICEGRRMVHFDNRELYVDGDAITVRDGCEMFITNSRIVASGVGVTVQNGTVHISNSQIEGAAASFAADAQARMFVRGSTFQGVSRRDERALVQDQGGNRWR